jgi:cell division protein YceG involved in septum cleavage
LTAALNPQPVDYLYYVREPSRDDGAHNFYTSESDFQRGVNALREWERHRDLENAQRPSQ